MMPGVGLTLCGAVFWNAMVAAGSNARMDTDFIMVVVMANLTVCFFGK